MNLRAVVLSSLAVVTAAGIACDDDPAGVTREFALLACPAGVLGVNSPIELQFSENVLGSTVTGGNIVVTDVETGTEVPGSLVVGAQANTVRFVPSDPLPFQRDLRLRIQNLLTATGNIPIGVTVCELTTQAPPIAELFWTQIPTATGNRLLGASQYAEDEGFVASAGGPIFEREGTDQDFVISLHDPHWSSSLDVSAISATRFFSAHIDIRENSFLVAEANAEDDNEDEYTVRLRTGLAVTRVVFRPITGSTEVFGVVGGGTALQATFFKWEPSPAPGSFVTQSFANTGNVQDIDFRANLEEGAAVSAGVVLPNQTTYGMAFVSSDSGRTWAMIPGSTAEPQTLFYRGVSRRSNGEVFAVGGNGAVVLFTPTGGGAYTREEIVVDATLESFDEDDPRALAFNDIQFAPDDDQRGWLVGQQLIGVEGGVPRFQGLIYETRDGGQTWTRQGVRDAPDFGASFPALNRIDARSTTAVWIVGDGGIVLSYSPQP